MSARITIRTVLAILVVMALAVTGPALGQGRATGIRISNVTTGAQAAILDVTLNTTSPWDSYFYTGFLGNRVSYFTTWSTSTTGPTVGGGTGTSSSSGFLAGASQLLNPLVNAVEWGDGSTIGSTTIPAVNSGVPGSYVGSLSHSYPAGGDYLIRVGVAFPNTGVITTGNPVIVPPGSPISVLQTQSSYVFTHTLSSATFTSFFANSVISAFTTPYSITLGITATTLASIPSILEVPTTSRLGLLVLIAALALGGIALLRR